jgi:hypothetical protein
VIGRVAAESISNKSSSVATKHSWKLCSMEFVINCTSYSFEWEDIGLFVTNFRTFAWRNERNQETLLRQPSLGSDSNLNAKQYNSVQYIQRKWCSLGRLRRRIWAKNS